MNVLQIKIILLKQNIYFVTLQKIWQDFIYGNL